MFKRRILIAVSVLLLAVTAVPSWGASFRRMNDQQFLDLCENGTEQGIINAIHSGANVNAEDDRGSALMRATYNGYANAVNAMVKAGVNVNAKVITGQTALMLAARDGRTEIANALINAGADVNINDIDGWAALLFAAYENYTETVNALLRAGADVNARDKNGLTALMWAAKGGHAAIGINIETINVLIEAGAEDMTDNNGKTALIHAVEDGNIEAVNALIDAGSYVKQRDNEGKTALDYARDNDNLKGTDALKRLEELSR